MYYVSHHCCVLSQTKTEIHVHFSQQLLNIFDENFVEKKLEGLESQVAFTGSMLSLIYFNMVIMSGVVFVVKIATNIHAVGIVISFELKEACVATDYFLVGVAT